MGRLSDCPVAVARWDVRRASQTRRVAVWRGLGIACVIGAGLALAVVLRTWGIGATFASCDQVVLPYQVHYSFGIRWIFAHVYGPVLPLIQRGWGEFLLWLGLPIGESAARLPIVTISLGQVVLTYLLVLRLWYTHAEAGLAALVCAVLPTLVTDAHYPWGYLTSSLFFGTLALWGTLAWFDDRKWWQLAIAALALAAHCLTNCYAFAVPLTLLVAWARAVALSRSHDRSVISVPFRSAVVGFVMPCLLALAVIGLSWHWTGQGQLGRLLVKYHVNCVGAGAFFVGSWLRIWLAQFGYLAGLIAAAGMLFGVAFLVRRQRSGLVALWAWAACLPLVLAVNPARIGYPGAYLIDGVYGGGLLAVLMMCAAWRKLRPHRRLRFMLPFVGALVFIHMTVGAADECLAGGRYSQWTGVRTGWGNLRPDTGIKAAGWYVRAHVPLHAVVMCLHTRWGMESPVAEYYTGRRVLAGYDHPSEILPALLKAVYPLADVVVVPAGYRRLVEPLADLECVCELTRSGRPVRFVYARKDLHLPHVTAEVTTLNARYDRDYQSRHIPMPLPAPPGMTMKLGRYQAAVRRLKSDEKAVAASNPLCIRVSVNTSSSE